MTPAIEVRRLEPRDDRSGFRSGDPALDRFFHHFAGQNQFKHHVGTTYVALVDGAIVGFVTVAACQVNIQDLPAERAKRLPSIHSQRCASHASRSTNGHRVQASGAR